MAGADAAGDFGAAAGEGPVACRGSCPEYAEGEVSSSLGPSSDAAKVSASSPELPCVASRDRASATALIDGRSWVSIDSMCMITGVSGLLRCGGGNCPEATRCSNAMVLSPVPNGGQPSSALYSVEPSENTSEAKFAPLPRATSGAR